MVCGLGFTPCYLDETKLHFRVLVIVHQFHRLIQRPSLQLLDPTGRRWEFLANRWTVWAFDSPMLPVELTTPSLQYQPPPQHLWSKGSLRRGHIEDQKLRTLSVQRATFLAILSVFSMLLSVEAYVIWLPIVGVEMFYDVLIEANCDVKMFFY